MNKSKVKQIIIIGIFIIGLFLRFYNLGNTIFDWDQENSVAFPAKDIIINHHLPLIGPRTGVGGLYIGPLYTYLAALFFSIFHLAPVSGAYLSATLASITLIVGFILIKKIFNLNVAIFFILILSTSSFILGFDRIPWNVNLLPLSSLLIFSGLWFVLKDKKSKGWFISGLGLILGVNSHFSVVFLILIIVAFLFLHRNKIGKSFLVLAGLMFIALLPILIFETRHGFILSSNLLKIPDLDPRP